jgi:hypothetical protein
MEKMLVLTYNSIFDDSDNALSPESLLKNISSINVLEIISWLTAQIHSREAEQATQKRLLDSFSVDFSDTTKAALSSFTRKYPNYVFINNQSSLMMDEIVLANYNKLPRKECSELTDEELLNIFKAYLLCSQKWTDKHAGISSNGTDYEDSIEEIMTKQDIPISEFKWRKDFRFQLYKANLFFEFCETNSLFHKCLESFLEEKNVSNYHEYLRNVLSFYIEPMMQNRRPSIVVFKKEDEEAKDFLNQFVLDVDKFQIGDDFKSLRDKFVLKISEGEYMILNHNLLIDKIYQGLQFDFCKTLIKNGALNKKGKKIKDFEEYKSILGNEFSETHLFYKIIEKVIETKNYTKLSGEKIKEKTGEGEPDYYIRDNNNLLLFEMKDVILNANTKQSDDINKIHDEICNKICKDDGKDRKGVGQLLHNADRFYKGEFLALDTCNTDVVSVYPVIVVNDSAFNANGVSNLIFRESEIFLESKYPHLKGKVNKPILIHLDALIYLIPHLNNDNINLSKIIQQYLSETDNNPCGKYKSFIDFVLETYEDKMYDIREELIKPCYPDYQKKPNVESSTNSNKNLNHNSIKKKVKKKLSTKKSKNKLIKKSIKRKKNTIKKKRRVGKSIIKKRRVRRRKFIEIKLSK